MWLLAKRVSSILYRNYVLLRRALRQLRRTKWNCWPPIRQIISKCLSERRRDTARSKSTKTQTERRLTTLMFMFRRKRSALISKLLKFRVKFDDNCGGVARHAQCPRAMPPGAGAKAARCQNSNNLNNNLNCGAFSHNNNYVNNDEAERVVRGDLLKRFKDNQLEMLLTAVESRGANVSDCVLLARCRDYSACVDDQDAHVRCCQVWRWPDLQHEAELKHLPFCASANDPVYICCNPYHWSRLCQPESPPPPYSRFAMDRLRPEDRAPSEPPQFSYTMLTCSEETSQVESRKWCQLAYWELSTRIGPLFSVDVPAINVFSDQLQGNGLCLSTLATQSNSTTESKRVRDKIKLGITLSNEMDGVWAYNRSDWPIFVNAPYNCHVYKVPSDHCVCIFDRNKAAATSMETNSTSSVLGPVDRLSIKISFAKGWGPNYQRQHINSCPCWLEVLLEPPCR